MSSFGSVSTASRDQSARPARKRPRPSSNTSCTGPTLRSSGSPGQCQASRTTFTRLRPISASTRTLPRRSTQPNPAIRPNTQTPCHTRFGGTTTLGSSNQEPRPPVQHHLGRIRQASGGTRHRKRRKRRMSGLGTCVTHRYQDLRDNAPSVGAAADLTRSSDGLDGGPDELETDPLGMGPDRRGGLRAGRRVRLHDRTTTQQVERRRRPIRDWRIPATRTRSPLRSGSRAPGR